jgi:hypothetical protein
LLVVVHQSARICGIDEDPMFQRMKLSLHMPEFEFKATFFLLFRSFRTVTLMHPYSLMHP